VKTLTENVKKAQRVIRRLLPALPAGDCSCYHALENAIMTRHEQIPQKVREDLAPIIGKYVK